MGVDERHRHLCGRSSSAAKKADALRKISFAPQAQLPVLLLQRLDPLSLLAVHTGAHPRIDLGLAHPRPQRLVDPDPQLARRYPLHRPVIGAQLLARCAADAPTSSGAGSTARTARSFSASLYRRVTSASQATSHVA